MDNSSGNAEEKPHSGTVHEPLDPQGLDEKVISPSRRNEEHISVSKDDTIPNLNSRTTTSAELPSVLLFAN
ncbi:hypothetical protein OCU04_006103 [Sclerotinia nivalis]|uniref:Uncharacterized protein n=1 Tax=Sclerotinia nivalis TaxID=352851 RepID=A0A9X0DJ25_9HELO|nr:hypothetical protein OCU04_006103 [Sclerotinia nivalis]